MASPSTPTSSTFDTVIARDRWLLLEAKTLPVGADRHLSRMQPHLELLAANRFIDYASAMAGDCQAREQWPEAQAYWLAALREHASRPAQDEVTAVMYQYLSCVGRDVGSAGAIGPIHLDDLVTEVFERSTANSRQAVCRALVLAGIAYDRTYELLDLRSTTLNEISNSLERLTADMRRAMVSHRLKTCRDRYNFVVDQLFQLHIMLCRRVNALAGDATLDELVGARPRLLDEFTKFSYLAPHGDGPLIGEVKRLLSSTLSAYVKEAEPGGTTMERFEEHASATLQRMFAHDSHWTACLLIPTVLNVATIVRRHYASIIERRVPALRLEVVKAVPRRPGDAATLSLRLTNAGEGGASECDLFLEVDGNAVDVERDSIPVGDVPAGADRTIDVPVRLPSTVEAFTLAYRLHWRDRSGERERSESARVETQRSIDWERLERDVMPYVLQSITETNRNRLKGRDSQLQTLRRGFQSQASFLITGQKRVGKTSLIRVFLGQMSDELNVLPMYLHVGSLGFATGDLGRLGHDIAQAIANEYRSRFNRSLGVSIASVHQWREAFNAHFTTFMSEVTARRQVRLAIAFDDFDDIPADLYSGEKGDALFLALRAVADKGVSFFLVGGQRLPPIQEAQGNRLNVFRSLTVDYLEPEALSQLVREPAPWLEYTNYAVETIATWSAGNPYFATLICQHVCEHALGHHDYCVTEQDVLRAIDELTGNIEQRQVFGHFWTDAPTASPEAVRQYEIRTAAVLRACATSQEAPMAYTRVVEVVAATETLDAVEAEEHLHQLSTRVRVLHLHGQDSRLVRIRIPLLTAWLKRQGSLVLHEVLASRASQTAITAPELVTAVEGLRYRGVRVLPDEVRRWLEQFGGPSDQRLMLKLVQTIRDRGLYTEEKLWVAIGDLHQMTREVVRRAGVLVRLDRGRPQNWFVSHADRSGKSGSVMAKNYRSANHVPERHCGSMEKVVAAIEKSPDERVVLLLVDDFVGTGEGAIRDLHRSVLPYLDDKLPKWRQRVKLFYGAVIGYEAGLLEVEESVPEVTVLCARRLGADQRAFHEDSSIFETGEERLRALRLAERVGGALEPGHALGHEDSQALIVFQDNVPNNTLPIFHKVGGSYNGVLWYPLFPRS